MTIEHDRARAVMRSRFDLFVRAMFPVLHNGEPLVLEPYLEPMHYALQQAATTDGSRLLVTMPPRMLKSFSACVCLPAWLLGCDPSLDIAVVTYAERLEREHTDKLRRLMRSPQYRSLFPNVVLDASRTDRLTTLQGGGYRPVTISGSFTGMGADVVILDDLQKAQDVGSDVMREQVLRFYQGTAVTRLNNPSAGRIIAIMHRLHLDDLPNMLIESGVFRHVNLPAIAQTDMVYPCYEGFEQRWPTGALLSPQRLGLTFLNQQRLSMGSAAFNAQYLQNPELVGQMVDPRRLHFVDQVMPDSEILLTVQSIDTAVNIGEHNDYSVISTFAFNGQRWCMVDMIRDRLEYPELQAASLVAANLWNPECVIIENSLMATALGRTLREANRTVRLSPTDSSKEERLAIAVETLYSGEVVFPRNEPWSNIVTRELVSFPGRHDDIVDTISHFVRWVRLRARGGWTPSDPGPHPFHGPRRRTRTVSQIRAGIPEARREWRKGT